VFNQNAKTALLKGKNVGPSKAGQRRNRRIEQGSMTKNTVILGKEHCLASGPILHDAGKSAARCKLSK